MVDPKIGFAIICKCRERQQGLDFLSVRRGPSSPAPGKWSFPGGKLALGEDNEEKRILSLVEAQCGGGKPSGLPPMIHIIRLFNETAKVKQQTIYHVFVLDTDSSKNNKDWLTWCPGVANGNDIDTVDVDVTFGEDMESVSTQGHFWMDMDALIEICSNSHPNPSVIPIDSRGGTLHPGLVKWIQNHGRSVLKMLITRSPKQIRARSSASNDASPRTVQGSRPADGVVKRTTFSTSGMYSPLYSSPLLPPPPQFSPFPSHVPIGMSLGVPSPMYSVPILYPQHPPPVKMDKGVVHNSIPVSVTANTPRNPIPLVQPSSKQVQHRSHIICQYFLKGSCKFGQSCRYLHPDLSGSKSPTPAFTIHQSTPTPLYQPVPRGPLVPLDSSHHAHPNLPGQHSLYTTLATQQVQAGNQGNSNKNIPFQLVGQVNTKLHGESTDSTNCGPNCLLTCEGKNIYFVSHHCVHHYKLSLSQGVPVAYPEQAVSGVDTFTVNRQTQNIVTAIFSTKMDGVVCIGTSGGSIMKYDFNTKQTVVILNGQSGPHITALLHYVTSDMCQVVVGGNASGMLFWHVTRPHQNGFVSLLSEQKHKTKITGLEIVGNQMISCSEDGQVYFWSVGGPMPVGLGSYTVCEAGAEELVSLLIVDQEYHFMALSKSISSEVSHLTPCVWKYGNPPSVVDCLRELTSSVCCAGVVEFAPSQSLVAIGLANGIVNIYSSPHFVLSAQLLFEDMNESSCVKMAATLETLPASHNNHPSLADALIVTLWSCGVIKICKAVR